VGGVVGRLRRTGRVVGVAGVATVWCGGLGLGDAGVALVALICGHAGPLAYQGIWRCVFTMGMPRSLAVSDIPAVEQRVGGVIDAGAPGVYLVTALLVAISTSAVAWMSANSSLSKPGANSSRRSGAMVIGNPSGMTAVLSSVPSFDGDAPR
jgi:hypothetical protein